MFLCKRVRSEMGVDSVGVGGGEPGGPAGGVLRLVVTRPVDESTRWPCASGRACSSSLARSAARRSSMLQTRRPQQFGPPPRRRRVVAAPLGGPRGSVAGRLGRRWWCRGDPAQGRGEGQEGDEPLPGPLPRRRRLRVLAARVGLAEGVQGPSGGLLVGGGAGSGARRRRPPCGPRRRRTARVARTGVDHAGGDHGVGPGPPRAASGRPAGPSQHTISTPLAPPCWPDRAHTRRPSRRPLPAPGVQILKPRARAPSMPRAHGDAGRAVRHPVVGADHRRGSRPRWITG